MSRHGHEYVGKHRRRNRDVVDDPTFDSDLWLTKVADVKVGDVITTLFSDTGEATVTELRRFDSGLWQAVLDNGRTTCLGGDDDIVEVVQR